MAAFEGGQTEHLSADEVHARALRALPDLGRGTVYATLAEFTEIGLLAALGAPEPVRFETNTEPHDHFRCRVCLRLFDLSTIASIRLPITREGFVIERIDTRAEGVCGECTDYEAGLSDGTHAILTNPPIPDALASRGVAGALLDGPLGTVLLAASPEGLLRVAFAEHADAKQLRLLAASRRGSELARSHLARATTQLQEYLSGERIAFDCAIDWAALRDHHPDVLHSTREIAYATSRSYTDLMAALAPRDLGWALGANPIALVAPCHRVTRGLEIPRVFVGGPERREWLLAHERRHAAGAR